MADNVTDQEIYQTSMNNTHQDQMANISSFQAKQHVNQVLGQIAWSTTYQNHYHKFMKQILFINKSKKGQAEQNIDSQGKTITWKNRWDVCYQMNLLVHSLKQNIQL